jgi:hypothetical protein
LGEEEEPMGRKGRACKVCGLTRRRSQTEAAGEQGVRGGGAGERRRGEGGEEEEVGERRWGRGECG